MTNYCVALCMYFSSYISEKFIHKASQDVAKIDLCLKAIKFFFFHNGLKLCVEENKRKCTTNKKTKTKKKKKTTRWYWTCIDKLCILSLYTQCFTKKKKCSMWFLLFQILYTCHNLLRVMSELLVYFYGFCGEKCFVWSFLPKTFDD